MLMKPFITSQFPYCPLALMFHSMLMFHERVLRLVCDDSQIFMNC